MRITLYISKSFFLPDSRLLDPETPSAVLRDIYSEVSEMNSCFLLAQHPKCPDDVLFKLAAICNWGSQFLLDDILENPNAGTATVVRVTETEIRLSGSPTLWFTLRVCRHKKSPKWLREIMHLRYLDC